MKKECCDVLGNQLDPSKNWIKFIKANGEEWIPAFIIKVDQEKCIGCGLCLKVCLNDVYEMRIISGKRKAVAVHSERCFGDCHCHKICPVKGGAMVCKPKTKNI